MLLSEVIFVKQGDNKRFIIVDAAMNDLLRPTLYEAHHNIEPLSDIGPATGIADIVGPVCETGDYLGKERQMPDLKTGDRIAVMSCGQLVKTFQRHEFSHKQILAAALSRHLSAEKSVALEAQP